MRAQKRPRWRPPDPTRPTTREAQVYALRGPFDIADHYRHLLSMGFVRWKSPDVSWQYAHISTKHVILSERNVIQIRQESSLCNHALGIGAGLGQPGKGLTPYRTNVGAISDGYGAVFHRSEEHTTE